MHPSKYQPLRVDIRSLCSPKSVHMLLKHVTGEIAEICSPIAPLVLIVLRDVAFIVKSVLRVGIKLNYENQ